MRSSKMATTLTCGGRVARCRSTAKTEVFENGKEQGSNTIGQAAVPSGSAILLRGHETGSLTGVHAIFRLTIKIVAVLLGEADSSVVRLSCLLISQPLFCFFLDATPHGPKVACLRAEIKRAKGVL